MSPKADTEPRPQARLWGQGDAAFRLLVESVEEYAIFFLDTDGFIRSWNAGAQRIKGYRADEIVGRHVRTFYPASDVAGGKPERALKTARTEGRYEDYGWRVRKDGTQFWANVVITPLYDPTGAHVGFAKVTRDLTDRAYRKFVEATNAIIWTTDASGIPNIDSPSWRAFTGQTEDEWRSLQGWAPLHPDDRPRLQIEWPAAKAERRTFEAEFRLRRHDGEYVWMEARAVPFFNEDGTVREWFGVTFDISARKRAELQRAEALEMERAARLEAEHAQSLWTTTLRSIGDAVIVADLDGRITFMNPVAETVTGWGATQALGKPAAEVLKTVDEKTRRPMRNPIDRALQPEHAGPKKHVLLLRDDGSAVPIDDRTAPIQDHTGQLFGAVLVFRDVTPERREAAARSDLLERERQARANAELANRAKDEFLATVSHELRNPLNAVLGWAKLLSMRDLPPDVRRHLATIERNARSQARLIDDVLDVSRVISGKLHLDLSVASVAQAVGDAVEAARPMAEAKGVILASNVEPGAEVYADQVRLQQIVSNLMSNAVKFTASGGRVDVDARRDGPVLRITVRDSGEGIDPSLLSVIFEPFRQADSSTTRRHGGLGLGLAIVRQLAQAHGGTVRAESAGKGAGATFIVELPARQSPAQSAVAAAGGSLAELPRLNGKRVLVVDDQPDAVELLHELLTTAGAEVQTARSAEEAWSRLASFRPDVLVSDIGMPDADGSDLIRRVRALPATAGGLTPAVAVTAYSRPEDAERALAAGFQRHLGKPVDPTQLVQVVAHLAGLHV